MTIHYDEGAAKLGAGAAIAMALVEELQKAGVLSADQVKSIYLAAVQTTESLPGAFHVDTLLSHLAKNVRENG